MFLFIALVSGFFVAEYEVRSDSTISVQDYERILGLHREDLETYVAGPNSFLNVSEHQIGGHESEETDAVVLIGKEGDPLSTQFAWDRSSECTWKDMSALLMEKAAYIQIRGCATDGHCRALFLLGKRGCQTYYWDLDLDGRFDERDVLLDEREVKDRYVRKGLTWVPAEREGKLVRLLIPGQEKKVEVQFDWAKGEWLDVPEVEE